jgi:N-formylglutamate deformylase
MTPAGGSATGLARHGPAAPPADQASYWRHEPQGAAVPVVLDSPHSGSVYPTDFRPAVALTLLRGGEDRFIDELFAHAPRHGATLIAARFARTYIDPNRARLDLDPDLLAEPWPEPLQPSEKSAMGVGLIFRLIGDGIPIYDRLLSVAEVRHRIDHYWRPYRDALQAALDAAHRTHGAVWHINCHSMTSVGNVLSPDPGRPRPDMVLGDLHGRSCAPEFTTFVAAVLEGLGYSVAINDPYAGAELVERHGDPAAGRHSLQIEVKRSLYMDEETLERHAGFCRLQSDLDRLTERICRMAAASVATRQSPSRAAPR